MSCHLIASLMKGDRRPGLGNLKLQTEKEQSQLIFTFLFPVLALLGQAFQ
jgi:hypothetical protein